MLTTNQKYLDVVNSNVRPKIEPYIIVSGENEEGDNVELEWKPSNIIELSYKRGIDPTGQTLPYMELTWKEFYFGKLNSQNYPEKYENIAKYMKVELYFEQDVSKISTWQDVKVYGGVEVPWNFHLGRTWGSLFKQNVSVSVDFPPLILTAKPTIQGHTITWVARDLLYFLNESVEKAFEGGIAYQNPLKWLALNERPNFASSFTIINALQLTFSELDNLGWDENDLDKIIVLRGLTKNLMKDYASIRNYYLDFVDNKIKIQKIHNLYYQTTPLFKFTTKIMREHPKLTKLLDVSAYSFKQYVHKLDSSNITEIDPSLEGTYQDYEGKRLNYAEYEYGTLGVSNLVNFTKNITNKAYYIGDEFTGVPTPIRVTPLKTFEFAQYLNNNKQGDVFVEDNKLNPYPAVNTYTRNRLDVLNHWFSSKRYSMEINSLHNIALEPGDYVDVETNLYNDNVPITKQAVVIGIEFTYNGTIKQKTYLHEVSYSG